MSKKHRLNKLKDWIRRIKKGNRKLSQDSRQRSELNHDLALVYLVAGPIDSTVEKKFVEDYLGLNRIIESTVKLTLIYKFKDSENYKDKKGKAKEAFEF